LVEYLRQMIGLAQSPNRQRFTCIVC
jgi:hypothetical protein